MLKEAKQALRISANVYDDEIISLIRAGALDLQIAGVVVPEDKRPSAEDSGKITDEIIFGVNEDDRTVTDDCTLKDALIIRAILTYVRCHFGSPTDYDRLKASYDEQKAQMMSATGYTTGAPFTEEAEK